MKSNFKTKRRFKMKVFIVTIMCLSQISLFACSSTTKSNEKSMENILSQEDEAKLSDGKDGDSLDEATTSNPYLEGIKRLESLNMDNIESVGKAFALDLLTEDYQRLESLYPYTSEMKDIILSDETKKNIIFHNLDLGEVEKIDEPYAYKYGTNRYVMVPIEASLRNMNFLISFNNENEIVGFSYEEYKRNDSIEARTISDDIEEEEFSFYSDGHVIPGTLTRPIGKANYPLVILIHGFGPSDRDLSVFANKPFQDIAWALAQAGIASFRYDKRTYIRENESDISSFTVYEETINDAVSATNMAKELGGVDPNRIYVLGFSQGGYLTPRIAELLPDATGYILVSSPAEHIKNYLKEQYEYLAMEDGQISLFEHDLINQISVDIDMLGKPSQIPDDVKVQGFYKDYWIDLNAYNPVQVASKITVPVLLIHGERDYQVTKKQFNLWQDIFLESENWTFKSYPELNHFMMKGEGNSYSSEYKEENYVDQQVIQDIANFILTN